jgi:hypothetical protein
LQIDNCKLQIGEAPRRLNSKFAILNWQFAMTSKVALTARAWQNKKGRREFPQSATALDPELA